MKKFTYDISKYKFRELVSEIYNVENLEKIHEIKPNMVRDEYKKMHIDTENTTDFHDLFYKRLNDNWTEMYESYEKFIKEEILPIMDEEFHYQYLPSFSIQLPE